MSEAERRATTTPAPPDLSRQCPRCGAVVLETELEWRAWPDLGLEIAECRCGTTIGREPDPVAEHRRDEGDDGMAEERAERQAAWAERSW